MHFSLPFSLVLGKGYIHSQQSCTAIEFMKKAVLARALHPDRDWKGSNQQQHLDHRCCGIFLQLQLI